MNSKKKGKTSYIEIDSLYFRNYKDRINDVRLLHPGEDYVVNKTAK